MPRPRRGLLQQPFTAARRGRRLHELAARERVRRVGAAADANQLFDPVVVRRDVGVSDRPRDLPAVALGPLEVHLGVAEADATPDVGLAAVTPDTNELEGPIGGREIGLLLDVEKELRRLLPAGGALTRFPWLNVGPELRAVEAVAGIEHQDLDALFRQVPGRHAPEAPLPMMTTGCTWADLMICMSVSLWRGNGGGREHVTAPRVRATVRGSGPGACARAGQKA